MPKKLCAYLCNEFTFMDVQIGTTNTTSLHLDLCRQTNQSRTLGQLKQSINISIPEHHSHEAQAQELQQSCASWALSIAEPASSWGWW